MRNTLQSTIVGQLVLATVTVSLTGCVLGDPKPIEYKRAVIVNESNMAERSITGEFTAPPKYPITVPGDVQVSFTIAARAPEFQSVHPSSSDLVTFPQKVDNGAERLTLANVVWQFDSPTNKWTLQAASQYRTGDPSAITSSGRGITAARLKVRYSGGGTVPDATGTASLPFIIGQDARNMMATAKPIWGDYVWVQAYPETAAELTAPYTLTWTVNGGARPGWSNLPMVDTIFSGTGTRTFGVTMTGANGISITRSWVMLVVNPPEECPPPQISC